MCTHRNECAIINIAVLGGDILAYNEAGYNASRKYKEKNIKRVPLDMQLEEYNKLKAAAERTGEKVNTYIKKAIAERMEREK